MDRIAVFAGAGQDRLVALTLGQRRLAAADLDARGKARHVPLPGTARGLVEVTHVEDDVPIG